MAATPRNAAAVSAHTRALLCTSSAKQGGKEMESDRIRSTGHEVLWVSLALESKSSDKRHDK